VLWIVGCSACWVLQHAGRIKTGTFTLENAAANPSAMLADTYQNLRCRIHRCDNIISHHHDDCDNECLKRSDTELMKWRTHCTILCLLWLDPNAGATPTFYVSCVRKYRICNRTCVTVRLQRWGRLRNRRSISRHSRRFFLQRIMAGSGPHLEFSSVCIDRFSPR